MRWLSSAQQGVANACAPHAGVPADELRLRPADCRARDGPDPRPARGTQTLACGTRVHEQTHRFSCTVHASTQELYVEKYADINWLAARNNVAQVDLYAPHTTLLDLLYSMCSAGPRPGDRAHTYVDRLILARTYVLRRGSWRLRARAQLLAPRAGLAAR